MFNAQSDRSIVSSLQHHYAVWLRAQFEQHLLIRFGRSDHIAGSVPEHMSNKDVGVVHWIYIRLRSHVQQGVESAQTAYKSKEKRN